MKRDANPEKGLEALDQCEYMVLAMTDGEGKPYCIPLNGVRAGEKIYFHCAKAGEKVDCLRTHPQVCLTAVGHQRVIQAIYETEYQCAVVRGTAGEVTDETEMRAFSRRSFAREIPVLRPSSARLISFIPANSPWSSSISAMACAIIGRKPLL